MSRSVSSLASPGLVAWLLAFALLALTPTPAGPALWSAVTRIA